MKCPYCDKNVSLTKDWVSHSNTCEVKNMPAILAPLPPADNTEKVSEPIKEKRRERKAKK